MRGGTVRLACCTACTVLPDRYLARWTVHRRTVSDTTCWMPACCVTNTRRAWTSLVLHSHLDDCAVGKRTTWDRCCHCHWAGGLVHWSGCHRYWPGCHGYRHFCCYSCKKKQTEVHMHTLHMYVCVCTCVYVCVCVSKPTVHCSVCDRHLSASGYKRHKCSAARQLSVSQPPGAKSCQRCVRWFKSAGGLKVHVHKCPLAGSSQQPSDSVDPAPRLVLQHQHCCPFHCPSCNRCFRSAAGFKRHNCERGKRPPARERLEFKFCCACGERYRRQQDPQRHEAGCSAATP